MNTKENLQEIINNSSLSDEDKNIWTVFIDNNEEEVLKDIFEVVKNSEEDLNFLTKNLKDKIVALQNQDVEALNKIIGEEKRYLENM